ncbi:MAG TPA: outer membrane beta-barrel protein [Sediminibacterium sp.]|nr:outer membrane beta-barrel protein [Sediminibacterium sp.]
MKKTILLLLGFTYTLLAAAQSDKKVKFDLSNRPSDHLMIQYGADSWLNRPDSVRTGGFSRHFNIYFMLDKPFKTNQKFSMAYGIGLGTSNMFFKNTYVDVKSVSTRLPFTKVDSTNHFNKFKVTNIYAEIPVELRYYSQPDNPAKSWKAALGIKVGTLLKTYSKGKDLVSKSGASIYGPSYVEKEVNKRFFNGTMLAVTGRVGLGFISLDASYQVNTVLKDGTGPAMHKFSLGITVSGL